ncbi:YccS family putative transporter [Rhodanobacter caeni]|uniref:YccS family putative transporter n=1 Tax=Rhodanobacter caeni TaxID=657654 RepID=A0ABN0U935_9GAMM
MKQTSTLSSYWFRLLGYDRFAECVRVLLALGGIVVYGLVSGELAAIIPILLGAIACALAETEDQWRNRLITLLVTLACFTVAAVAVEWLLPYPVAFAIGLWLSTVLLVMLGALSGRYSTIAGATLILAVYTMLASDLAGGAPTGLLLEPARMLAGAAWYGVLSLLWSALSPQQAVRHALARLFNALADQLDGKAALFLPLRGRDDQALQLELARRNENVVTALNDTRLMLIDRIGSRRARGATAVLLQRYFMAQDIHERINSSHYPYDALATAFFHSDVLFRCEHLLRLQASRCRQLADALRRRSRIGRDDDVEAAFADVRTSIESLRQTPHEPALLRALDGLASNLAAIHDLLDGKVLLDRHMESTLQDPAPQSLADAWARIRAQFSPRAPRFRHAIRLATALLAGDVVMRLLHPQHGYWIMMTTLFVCQPSYHATWRVLLQRLGGTIAGLVIGWAALNSITPQWQLPLVALTGVAFFAARHRRYGVATAMITLFVIMLVNQVGDGYAVMLPRLLDTLAGAAIAALAIHFILPDWQARQPGQLLADTLHSDARYLARILPQYRSGRHDDLDYRIARRDAHNAIAALSGLLGQMLREPGGKHRHDDVLLRFLTAAQVLLGHLSTLGSHRQVLSADAVDAVMQRGGQAVAALERVADALQRSAQAAGPADHPDDPTEAVPDDDAATLVLNQLALVRGQCRKLADLTAEWQPA